jgi:exopolysaccharide biosynthesis protein
MAFSTVIALIAAASAAVTPAELPLGPASLHEQRTTRQIADGVRWTHITRRGKGGPFRVDVLAVDDRRMAVLSGRDRVPGLERPSAMAKRHHAVAGVNGGYFALGAPDVGDPVGLVLDAGAVLSEPVGARTAFLVPRSAGEPARVAALRWGGTLTAGGASRLVDGVNRNRGRIPACGGVGGDEPTERIDPARTCTDDSELVVLTPAFGAGTRTAAGGVEAVVRDGAVISVRRAADTPIPRDGYVLSGSGGAGRFLRRHLAPGDVPRLDLALRSAKQTLSPGDYAAILGGAPRLVRRGRVRLPPGLEGRSSDTGRNPRTVAGVSADGTVLLITIDGRRPGWSLGATLREAAGTARALGAADAVNLDSGGSTTMTIRSRVVNRPSDPGGERAVANGLFVVPGDARDLP